MIDSTESVVKRPIEETSLSAKITKLTGRKIVK
ncbi:hypothetical protein ACUXE7_001264 [Staphylococcus hominis]